MAENIQPPFHNVAIYMIQSIGMHHVPHQASWGQLHLLQWGVWRRGRLGGQSANRATVRIFSTPQPQLGKNMASQVIEYSIVYDIYKYLCIRIDNMKK